MYGLPGLVLGLVAAQIVYTVIGWAFQTMIAGTPFDIAEAQAR
jgi:hypothetical protein